MSIQTIGKQVRHRRQAVGLTQQRLAKLADLSRQTVQRLEAGTIKDLSFQRLVAIVERTPTTRFCYDRASLLGWALWSGS